MSSSELEIQKAADGQQEQQVPAGAEIVGAKEPESDTNASTQAERDFAAAEQYKNQGNDMLKSKYTPLPITGHVISAISGLLATRNEFRECTFRVPPST